ncbi:hypothetical protein GCM10009539_57710 [Cryptosporangium japonicum]|uniref:Uncharacterized protein n=1 Tax=Cryptosporangium japonicum TaxID=80872 RepID=A0ABN0UWX3_9ACTN
MELHALDTDQPEDVGEAVNRTGTRASDPSTLEFAKTSHAQPCSISDHLLSQPHPQPMAAHSTTEHQHHLPP